MRSYNDKNKEQSMTSVFLSGSRAVSRLNDVIRERLDNMTNNGLQILVGDANGADKAMQTFLAEKGYSTVSVYCSGSHCRNNVGNWPTVNVDVDPQLKGRAFYTQKDRFMARDADYGFILWDGKSTGSISNLYELLSGRKKVVLYFAPEKKFYTIRNRDEAEYLFGRCDPSTIRDIRKKIAGVSNILSKSDRSQISMSFL